MTTRVTIKNDGPSRVRVTPQAIARDATVRDAGGGNAEATWGREVSRGPSPHVSPVELAAGESTELYVHAHQSLHVDELE